MEANFVISAYLRQREPAPKGMILTLERAEGRPRFYATYMIVRRKPTARMSGRNPPKPLDMAVIERMRKRLMKEPVEENENEYPEGINGTWKVNEGENEPPKEINSTEEPLPELLEEKPNGNEELDPGETFEDYEVIEKNIGICAKDEADADRQVKQYMIKRAKTPLHKMLQPERADFCPKYTAHCIFVRRKPTAKWANMIPSREVNSAIVARMKKEAEDAWKIKRVAFEEKLNRDNEDWDRAEASIAEQPNN